MFLCHIAACLSLCLSLPLSLASEREESVNISSSEDYKNPCDMLIGQHWRAARGRKAVTGAPVF